MAMFGMGLGAMGIAPDYANAELIDNTSSSSVSYPTYTPQQNGYIFGCGYGTSGSNPKFGVKVGNMDIVLIDGAGSEYIGAIVPVAAGEQYTMTVRFAGSNRGVYFVPFK